MRSCSGFLDIIWYENKLKFTKNPGFMFDTQLTLYTSYILRYHAFWSLFTGIPDIFLWSLMDIICILSIVIMIRIMKLLLLHVCGRLANKKYRAEKASILNGYVSSIIILSVLYYFSNVYFWMSIIPIRMHNWRKMSHRQIQSWASPSYIIYFFSIITYNFLD